jgi:RNA polymerase-binding transcription factor DksA
MAGYGNADDHVAAQLNHVEDSLALHRLKQDSSRVLSDGVCKAEDCGLDIDPARVEANPYVKFCFSCQSKSENKTDRRFTFKNPYVP